MAELRVFEDAGELGAALADELLDRYEESNGAFLLGCPGGRSLRSTYRALAEQRPDLARCSIVMMDEYVPTPPTQADHSCRGFAQRHICAPLDVSEERLWVPDPQDATSYDERIAAAGGVDVFLLASGSSDGHVGFLPPGSPLDGRTAVVRLAESTRRDNLKTFPHFRSVDDVPTRGVTVGLATFADSRALRLVMHGREKQEATARLLELAEFDPAWPASIVHEHEDAAILVDREALP